MHGSQYVSLFDVNFFANHANFIAFLVMPFYAAFPHSLTLVFLKVISYLSGAFILYIIAKKNLNWFGATILMLLFLFYPPNLFGMAYEFDFESLSPLFLFLLYHFFKEEKFYAFIITCVLTMTIKENMPLIVMAFGVYAIFSRRRDKLRWGLIPFFLGLVSFYTLTCLVVPFFSKSSSHPYLALYSHLGSSPIEIIKTVLSHPDKIINDMFKHKDLNYLSDLFGPLGYLSILSPHILFLVSPIILQHLLSQARQEHTIHYQYAISLAPFIFLATMNSLRVIRYKASTFTYYTLLGLIVLLSMVSVAKNIEPIASRIQPYKNDNLDTVRWQMIKKIPKNAGVIATFDFLAELSTRKSLYAFYKIYCPLYQNGEKPFVIPDGVSYALVDFRDPWLREEADANPEFVNSHIREFFKTHNWRLEETVRNIFLYKRAESP